MSHVCPGSCPRDPNGAFIHDYVLRKVSEGIVGMALVPVRGRWARGSLSAHTATYRPNLGISLKIIRILRYAGHPARRVLAD